MVVAYIKVLSQDVVQKTDANHWITQQEYTAAGLHVKNQTLKFMNMKQKY
jgi:YD repeat-containing protein